MKKLFYVMLVLALLVPASAFASGTLIYEQGSKASAQAGAFVARADDPSALFYNPAGSAFFGKGFRFAFSMTMINVGVKYTSPTVGSWKNTADRFFMPSTFLTYGFNDRVTVGFSVAAPFNLATDWNQNFPGRFVSRHSKLVTTGYHPTIAFKVNDNHAFSFGLDYYYSTILLTRNLDTTALSTVYNGMLGNLWVTPGVTFPGFPANTVPQYYSSEAYLTTEVSDASLGWDVGYKFKNDHWAVGATYKSKVGFNYTGHTYFYTDQERVAPLNSIVGYDLFPAQATSISLDSIPAIWAIGVAYTGEPFTVEFDIQRSQWSEWSRATAHFSNPTTFNTTSVVPATEEFVHDWKDTYGYRLGMGYKLNDTIELRGGILYDESPVPSHTLSPVLPDNDRWSLQFGMGYTHENWGFDWYLMYIKFATANVTADNVNRYGETGLPNLGPYASLYRTTYDMLPDGSYKGTAWLAGFQFNYKF